MYGATVPSASKGIPALAYLDDSWLPNFLAFHGQTLRVAMVVSFLCGHFLSPKKYDFRRTRLQQYLDRLCDSDTTTFRAQQDKLDKLPNLLRAAPDAGCLSFRTLQCIEGKCMSMTVGIQEASLWTHAMFAVHADPEKSGLCKKLGLSTLRKTQELTFYASSSSGLKCRIPHNRGRGTERDNMRQSWQNNRLMRHPSHGGAW